MNAAQARTYIRLARNGWLLDRTAQDGTVLVVQSSETEPEFVRWMSIDKHGGMFMLGPRGEQLVEPNNSDEQ